MIYLILVHFWHQLNCSNYLTKNDWISFKQYTYFKVSLYYWCNLNFFLNAIHTIFYLSNLPLMTKYLRLYLFSFICDWCHYFFHKYLIIFFWFNYSFLFSYVIMIFILWGCNIFLLSLGLYYLGLGQYLLLWSNYFSSYILLIFLFPFF